MTAVAERPRTKQPSGPRRRDPVSVYAQKVLSGKIVAGRAVRMACQRHLTDLARERTKAFPFYFDRVAAQHVIDFFPRFLTLESGAPFVLPDWLQFCYGCIFGWKRASDDLRKYQYGFFESAKGSGKALALDTPIATPTGWTTMGALVAGDQVFDDRGRPTTVLEAHATQIGRECFAVEFDDGALIVADAEHLWFTEQRHASRADGRFGHAGVKRADRGRWKFGVRTTREIARTVRYKNGNYQSANHSVPLAGPLAMPPQDLPIEPYVLGVWLGDGDSDCARVTIGDQDTELVAHLSACVAVGDRQRLEGAGRYTIGAIDETKCSRGHERATESHNGRCRACERQRDHAERNGGTVEPQTNVPMAIGLRSIGVLGNKHIPANYLRSSVDQRLALLQGLMDTDGHIAPANGECEFSVTNEALATGALELIRSLGIKAACKQGDAKIHGRVVSQRWRIHFHPPHDLPVFRLRRKLKWQMQRHDRRRLSGDRRIVSATPVESVPVRCITVDSPSHLFLAGHEMIPTHNSPSAGGIGLYGMAFDDEPYAEIYSAAFDKTQASIILNDAIRMASNSSDLSEILTIDKYNIAHDASGSFFRAVSSEHRGKSGPRPYYVLGDEIHEHRDGRVLNKLLAGFKGRLQPLALLYTNSGSDRTSICWEYHQKSLAVLDGSVVDEQWFGYVCHLDPCEECFDQGYRQPKDGCEKCDDWTDPAVWPKVAPALGVVIQPKYQQDAIDAALSLPSEYALKRRLNFCIWTETHQTWISAQKWDACKAPSLIIPGARVSACAAAFDMSEKLDLTAGDFAQRIDDDPGMKADDVELTTVEDGKEVTQTLNLNFRIVLTPYFWIPEDTMLSRIDTERIPYDAWRRREGSRLEVTPGPIVDHDLIFEQFKNTLAPKFKPTIVGYDPHNATQFGAALRDRGKFNAVEVPQGRRLSEAFKWFEALVMARRIIHDGDPILGWCVANCEAKFDRYRNMWVEKPSATKRIDGAMAAVMALQLLMTMPKAPEYKLLIVGGRR